MIDIAIVGGGIGGLTTAIALQQRGMEARVYEAAPSLGAVGAGIWVPPNAIRVLDRLGLAEAVAAAGAALWRPEIHDAASGPLQVVDLSAGRGRWPTIAVHRARLQEVLSAGVAPGTLHLGRTCRAVRTDAERPILLFEDGSEGEADVIVGADGLRSVVRGALFPAVTLRYSGQTSYRAVQTFRLPPELTGVGREIWGPGCRFGFSTIGAQQVYWYATADAPAGGEDAPGTVHRHLRALFARFPKLVRDLLDACDSPVVRTDILDFVPIRRWHQGRVVLVGDAAHATTPNLGQGGAQAIEDAWVLADQMSRTANPAQAFIAFERIRRPKAMKVTRLSRRLGAVAHAKNPLARRLRNGLMRSVPSRVLRRQMEGLYEVNF